MNGKFYIETRGVKYLVAAEESVIKMISISRGGVSLISITPMRRMLEQSHEGTKSSSIRHYLAVHIMQKSRLRGGPMKKKMFGSLLLLLVF